MFPEEDDPYEGTSWAEYESGPYCEHWSGADDCERRCAKCNEPCHSHWAQHHDFENEPEPAA